MFRLIALGYAGIRRIARAIVTRFSFVDRVIGDRLRRMEQRLPTQRLFESLATVDSVKCHGFRLAFPPHDVATVSSILLHGDYEPETREVIQKRLKPGMTFVDLGANVGIFTLFGARAVGTTGHVFAFEPAPTTMRYLERNVRENGLRDVVTLVPSAVTDHVGVVRFIFNERYSIGAHIAEDGDRGMVLEVPATSLDEYFRNAGWPSVHLVKMDVEGAELAALRGMSALVQRNSRIAVIFEFLYTAFGRDLRRAEELFSILNGLGFRHFRVLHRDGAALSLPQDIPGLLALSKRTYLNILAERP